MNQFEVIELFTDELILLSNRNAITPTHIILSESKKELRDTYLQNNPLLQHLPLILVESTQDAIVNMQINVQISTFVSSKFLRYLQGDYTQQSTNIQNKFYAIYRKNHPFHSKMDHLIHILQASM